jgi:hypothetical protein
MAWVFACTWLAVLWTNEMFMWQTVNVTMNKKVLQRKADGALESVGSSLSLRAPLSSEKGNSPKTVRLFL